MRHGEGHSRKASLRGGSGVTVSAPRVTEQGRGGEGACFLSVVPLPAPQVLLSPTGRPELRSQAQSPRKESPPCHQTPTDSLGAPAVPTAPLPAGARTGWPRVRNGTCCPGRWARRSPAARSPRTSAQTQRQCPRCPLHTQRGRWVSCSGLSRAQSQHRVTAPLRGPPSARGVRRRVAPWSLSPHLPPPPAAGTPHRTPTAHPTPAVPSEVAVRPPLRVWTSGAARPTGRPGRRAARPRPRRPDPPDRPGQRRPRASTTRPGQRRERRGTYCASAGRLLGPLSPRPWGQRRGAPSAAGPGLRSGRHGPAAPAARAGGAPRAGAARRERCHSCRRTTPPARPAEQVGAAAPSGGAGRPPGPQRLPAKPPVPGPAPPPRGPRRGTRPGAGPRLGPCGAGSSAPETGCFGVLA